MRADITPGATFPDYALPDHTETVRVLLADPQRLTAMTTAATLAGHRDAARRVAEVALEVAMADRGRIR